METSPPPRSGPARGADALAAQMHAEGVRTVFSVSGNQIMPIYDACLDLGIRIVHARHEAAAVAMADGWAQCTGDVGIALVTAAPGFANALGGLYPARMAESAVVLISGDSPIGRDGDLPFQEFAQTAASAPFVKRALRSTDATRLAADFADLCRVARSGRRGPVHMAVPFDAVNAPLDEAAIAQSRSAASRAGGADVLPLAHGTAERLLDLLRRACRPVLLTGPQANRTRAAALLERLRHQLQVPAIPLESPRGLRDPSAGALAALLPQADLVLLLGKQADFVVAHLAEQAFGTAGVVAIDPDGEALERARRLAGARFVLGAQADVLDAAESLLAACADGKARAGDGADTTAVRDPDWCERIDAARAVRALANGAPPPAFVRELQRLQAWFEQSADTVLVCDGGEFGQWAQATLHGPARLINGISGAIGFGLPMAIGAALARPDARVLLAMGDGTAGFHPAELDTAVRHGARVVALVGNDARWNAEYLIQVREYGAERAFACELDPRTRYDRVAEGFGAFGAFVDRGDDLLPAIEAAFASGRTALVDWRIDGAAAPSFAAGAVAGGHA